MKWLLFLAAARRQAVTRHPGAPRRGSPVWAALLVLLVACGQALAAAPLETALPPRGDPLTVTAVPATTRYEPAVPSASPSLAVPAASPTVTPVPARTVVSNLASATAREPEPTVIIVTPTPTAQTKAQPTLGAFSITPIAGATLVTPNPTAVSTQGVGPSSVNILLIGTDSRAIDPTFRTDTLIVVSINKSAGTVSLLSIPRDLFVYIPTFGMARINRAFQLADTVAFPGGGPALLEQTILFNLGVPIQYYASVDFGGFRKVVDTLGGIDVPVNCQLTEYKLKDPALDERVASNYDLYTQPIGMAHMDGALALWFARARPVGGDFFRGYRQRQVLRAIYHKSLSLNIIPKIPALYSGFHDVVQTDMGLWDMMQFAPLTGKLDDSNIRSLSIGPNQVTGWTTPDGEDVLIPKPDAIALVVKDFLNGSVANQIAKPLTWIEVSNAGPSTDAPLAMETLSNDGFGVKSGASALATDFTTIVDHTTSPKGSPIQRLQSLLHVSDQHVVAQPDANNPYSFQVILGADYNSCPRTDWMDTTGTPTPAP